MPKKILYCIFTIYDRILTDLDPYLTNAFKLLKFSEQRKNPLLAEQQSLKNIHLVWLASGELQLDPRPRHCRLRPGGGPPAVAAAPQRRGPTKARSKCPSGPYVVELTTIKTLTRTETIRVADPPRAPPLPLFAEAFLC